jgi:hypothetical protein
MPHDTAPSIERLDALVERLERLSTQNARYRRALFAVAVVAVGGAAMGNAPAQRAPDEIRARRFVLVDVSGARRGSCSTART